MIIVTGAGAAPPLAALLRGLSQAARVHVRHDLPARVTEAALARLPEDRWDWGQGMRAELARVPAGAPRRQFAVGIVQVALVARPRRQARTIAGIAVLALSAAATLAAHALLPVAQLFAAVTGLLLTGYTALRLTWGVPGRRRPAHAEPRVPAGSLVRALMLLGIAVAVTVMVYTVGTARPRYSGPDRAFFSVYLALLTTGYVALALSARRAADTVALRWGAVGGLVCVLAWAGPVAIGRSGTEDGLSGYSWLTAGAVILLVSTAAATRTASSDSGVRAALWSGLISALAMFTVGMIAVTLIPHRPAGADVVGADFGGLSLGLGVLPPAAVVLGLVGAAIGAVIAAATGRAAGQWSIFSPTTQATMPNSSRILRTDTGSPSNTIA